VAGEVIDNKISEIVDITHPGGMITRFFLITEVIEPESGHRIVTLLNNDGATTWDDLGLLEFALAQVRRAAEYSCGNSGCENEMLHGDDEDNEGGD